MAEIVIPEFMDEAAVPSLEWGYSLRFRQRSNCVAPTICGVIHRTYLITSGLRLTEEQSCSKMRSD